MTVYTKEKMAKCRTAALDLLIKVGFSWYLVYFLSHKPSVQGEKPKLH